jgi:ribonuclease HI
MSSLYTDGSCLKNPGGPGGWAFVSICHNEVEWHVSGGDKSTTNNRMELTAVIEGINFSSKYTTMTIYSDSMYVINCAKGTWQRKKNTDLWDLYNDASKGKKINWIWVKGHNGDKYNEIVDKLARKEANDICI